MCIDKKSLCITLFLSATIALFTGITILNHHLAIRNFTAKTIYKMMYNAYKCHFITEVESINIFTCSITCNNVRVRPETPEEESLPWYWQAKRLVFHFSPLDFLFSRKLTMAIHINDAQIESMVNEKGLPLADHIKDLFFGAKFKIPLAIKLLKMKNVQLMLHNDQHQVIGTISWSGISKKGIQLKSMLYIEKGFIKYGDNAYINNITGSLYSSLAKNGSSTLLLDARAKLPCHQNQYCFIDGQLHEERGNFYIRSQDKQFLFKGELQKNILEITSTLNTPFLSAITRLFPFNEQFDIKTAIALNDGKTDATITSKRLPLTGTIHVHKNHAQFDITNIKAINELFKTAWSIAQQSVTCSGSLDSDQQNISFQIPLKNQQTTKEYVIKGTVSKNENNITIDGNGGPFNWHFHGIYKPTIQIDGCVKKNDKILGEIKSSYNNQCSFTCALNYQELKDILPEQIKNQLDGNAIIIIDGTLKNKKIILNIHLKDGIVIAGSFHNILNDLTAKIVFDYEKRTLSIQQLRCNFHHGTLLVPQATISFDNQWKPETVYIPCIGDHCLLSLDKNFGVVSGNLLFQYFNKKPSISGTLITERSFIQDFKFLTRAAQTKPWLWTKPIELNLRIETKEPIRIHAHQVQTHLNASVSIKQHHMQPTINGTIRLQGGSLIFPYSRLKIIHGALYFAADQNLDPLIDLIAKTTMHFYNITLQVTGSVRQPMVQLSSVPTLPEEKIAALLITGSPTVSLNMIAPALVVEYLKQQVLEHSSQLFEPQQSVQTLLKPLKHIKFTPTFTDETGRTGLYGGVEVDLGKRLQAKVQKNLNLQEDTQFEINYRLSDELNLQAFKDEQGNVGGQVEMRLKL